MLKLIQMQYIEKGQDPAYDNKTPSWQGHMYINQAGKDRSQLDKLWVTEDVVCVFLPEGQKNMKRLKRGPIQQDTQAEKYKAKQHTNWKNRETKERRKKEQLRGKFIWLTSCSTPAVPPQFVRPKVRSDRAPLLATTVCSTTSVSTPAIREWYTAVASCSAKTTFS